MLITDKKVSLRLGALSFKKIFLCSNIQSVMIYPVNFRELAPYDLPTLGL